MLNTPLCRQLGIKHPILNAPMGGGIAGPELAAPVVPPLPGFEGDMEYGCLDAGESRTLLNDIQPAAEIVRDIIRESEQIIGGRIEEGRFRES